MLAGLSNLPPGGVPGTRTDTPRSVIIHGGTDSVAGGGAHGGLASDLRDIREMREMRGRGSAAWGRDRDPGEDLDGRLDDDLV